MPPIIEHMHELGVKSQSAQLPVSGPLSPPARQRLVDAHQPHSARPVHVPHVVASPHGSLELHSELVHDQSPQLPVVGPVLVPWAQREVVPHQPHDAWRVHSAQSVYGHVSVMAMQLVVVHFQSPQLPAVGPPEVPAWHVPLVAHHPQPARDAHASQVVDVEQVSIMPPLHIVEVHRHDPHAPVSGPDAVPRWQVIVSAHQPHGNSPVHALQSVAPHSVIGARHVPASQVRVPVQLSPAQHGSPAPPQPAAMPHMLSVHTSPVPHSAGGLQQRWPDSPQGKQRPSSQTRPRRQRSISQHASPSRPHSPAGISHVPLSPQIRSVQHSLPSRHGTPVGAQQLLRTQSSSPQQSSGESQVAPFGVAQQRPSVPHTAPAVHRGDRAQQLVPTALHIPGSPVSPPITPPSRRPPLSRLPGPSSPPAHAASERTETPKKMHECRKRKESSPIGLSYTALPTAQTSSWRDRTGWSPPDSP